MQNLLKQIKKLRKNPVAKTISRRLREFESFKGKDTKEWFSELCFCILTANSKAETALRIQRQLGASGFCKLCKNDLSKCIRKNKHRFHNNKARFIVEARQYTDIKQTIQGIAEISGEEAAREWLVENIKGLGYKEASHFLRNVGYKNLAILDRHILNLMKEHGFIGERPKSLNKKKYLEIEKKFKKMAKKLEMAPAELDLYMWYMKTGEVLK